MNEDAVLKIILKAQEGESQVMNGWKDGRMDGWMDAWMDAWMVAWIVYNEKSKLYLWVQDTCGYLEKSYFFFYGAVAQSPLHVPLSEEADGQ